ncbi:hypothetical protein [Pseudodesulfovibrio sp. zrk46]|uniref:hypothetical protein n=1 Tax=Pseudodesulfovibrio sp. zrk46 TaxID=2725288 RepID=UPI00144940D6|nr:hypothetical protein [Pseudodesulfovibrio sp. zrk46]QJB55328.1 hypothetical protein HFN16_02450 [Pseudodesulfovibrio sp. zrk46]
MTLSVTPEGLLESIVRQYVGRHELRNSENKERRGFFRIDVNIPAIVSYMGEDRSVRYQAAKITDISPSGVHLVCSGNQVCGVAAETNARGFQFELFFSYTEDESTIHLDCEAQRIALDDGDVHVGARLLFTSRGGQEAYRELLEHLGPSATDSEIFNL